MIKSVIGVYPSSNIVNFASHYEKAINNKKYDSYEVVEEKNFIFLFGYKHSEEQIRNELKREIDGHYESNTLEEYVNKIKQNIVDEKARLILVRSII